MTDAAPYRISAEHMPYRTAGSAGRPEYTGWQDEQMSWKTTCYIGDWSFVPQIRVQGLDAERLFTDLSVNNIADFPEGRAKHCIQCNEDGKVIAEGILFRHGADDLEYQCGTPSWTLYNADVGGYDVEISFPRTHKLQVSGPFALAVLEKITQAKLRDVQFMHLTHGSIKDYDVAFLRQGMAGEIGFELHGPIENRDAVWAAVLEAGQEFGIRQLGVRTIQTNHLEAAYPTTGIHFFNALEDERRADYRDWVKRQPVTAWKGTALEGRMQNWAFAFTGSWDGDDIEELYRSPVEMGWTKVIKFDHEFVGRAALEAEVAQPNRTLVTLEYNSDDVMSVYASLFGDGDIYRLIEIPLPPYSCCWTDWILKDGEKVGHATWPGYSVFFRRILSLSFIDVACSEPGTEVSVLWGDPGQPQCEIRATVAPAPYLDAVAGVDRRRELRRG
jgi:vanillate/3-O-methylgallate O-demethylase